MHVLEVVVGSETLWDILRSPRDKGQTGLRSSHVLQVVMSGETLWDILRVLGTRDRQD